MQSEEVGRHDGRAQEAEEDAARDDVVYDVIRVVLLQPLLDLAKHLADLPEQVTLVLRHCVTYMK